MSEWLYKHCRRPQVKEFIEFLENYDPDLKIVYNSWVEMYHFGTSFIVCHNILFIEEDRNGLSKPLTVGIMLDLLGKYPQQMEVSTYSYNEYFKSKEPELHSQLIIENVYFR